MAQSTALADLVQDRIDAHLDSHLPILLGVSEDLAAVTRFSRQLLSAGKRFRARFCHLGWSCGPGNADRPAAGSVVTAAAALEIFHAAALVHDDLIDNSDTRRGHPSAHRHLEALHRDGGYSGDAEGFGRAGALLTGDLLLALSDELFDEAAQEGDARQALEAKREFSRMRLEVTAGQYLDVLEESAWSTRDETDQLSRAEQIVVYKSAKYSIEEPLAIGAILGGASEADIAALRRYGLPLGVAFQLRDDLLGVFGDPATTGKPAADDLREGKRTVLIALARQSMTPPERGWLDARLGDPGIGPDDVEALREAIRRSGAVRGLEDRVERELAAADAALEGTALPDSVRRDLRALAVAAVHRDF